MLQNNFFTSSEQSELARRALDRTRDYRYNSRTFGLARVRTALRLFGDPLAGVKVVHVAGSKGKGSVCAMVTAGLVAAEKRVGTFTSPAIFEDREMIAINGKALSRLAWQKLCRQYEAKIPPALTHFETMFVLACLAFRDAGVAYAVIEVGLGGRLDATNVVNPSVTVLCPIEKEHTDLLGKTLAAIAAEKLGIIKQSVPVIIGLQKASIKQQIAQKCRAKKAPLYVASNVPPHTFGLLGAHQKENARVAACVLQLLHISFPQKLKKPLVMPGRCMVLRQKPLLVVDAAHTVESAKALRCVLDDLLKGAACTFLFSSLADKPVKKILKILVRHGDALIFTQLDHPRAMPLTVLQKNAPGAVVMPNPADACRSVFSFQKPACIVGSFQLVRVAYDNWADLIPLKSIKSLRGSLQAIDTTIKRDQDRL